MSSSARQPGPLVHERRDPAELRALLGAAFERSLLAMVVVDEDVETLCANPAAGRMFGAAPASLVGRRIVDFSAADRTDQGDQDTVAFRPGDLNHLERETEFVSASGALVRAQMCVDVLTPAEGRRLFLVQLGDITDHHLRRRLPAGSEQRYRQLAGNLSESAAVVFDHDLRLQLAVGDSPVAGGGDGCLTGRLLAEVLPPPVFELLEEPYRQAIAGHPSDFEYTSPIHGGQCRVRVRPVIGPAGTVVNGLATSEDVSRDRARESQLQQIDRLTPFGSCQYDRRSGWVFDDELLNLWGVDSAVDPLLVIDALVLPEDRAVTTDSWAQVLSRGGRSSPQYRIHHGMTDELRYLKSTCEAVVDAGGALVRAVATHVDVTDAVAAREVAVLAEAEAADDRTLLRQVNDAVATTNSAMGALTQSAVPSPAATGPATVPRTLTPDQQTVEFGVVAHRDEERRLAGDPDAGLRGAVAEQLALELGALNGSAAFQQPLDERIDGEARHFIVAPVRHEGAVLGLLSIFRTADTPYEPGDERPVQLLADRVGSSLAESQRREVRDQERVERLAVADRLLELTIEQRELLEQLASTETRERALLAEAVHDDPMQLIVAAILRIDNVRLRLTGEHGEELDRVATLLETSVERLRKLIVAISPPELSGGLGVALRNLAEGIFIGTSTVVTVIGLQHVPLAPRAMATAYRILREALVNARKHARASTVTLRLEEHDRSVVLSLTDDGVGAQSLKAEPGHFGVATMRARANAENAHLHLGCAPGLGTTVVLRLPVSRDGRS